MLCFSTAPLLAAAALFLSSVGATERALTCDTSLNVHILNCQFGVIVVKTALYGRTVREICSKDRPLNQLSNTQCSLSGTEELIRNRCDGKQRCEINSQDWGNVDPCPGTHKYVDTNYTCAPAIQVTACEGSFATLNCDDGQVIFVYGADYGRRDDKICGHRRRRREVQNMDCSSPTKVIAERCNGKNNCTVEVNNKVLGDPCIGTYKYLEVAYICEYPLITPNPSKY